MIHLKNDSRIASHGSAALTVDEGLEIRYSVAMSVDMDLSTQCSTKGLPLQLLPEVRGHTI